MKAFVEDFVLEVLTPEWCNKMEFVGSSHSNIKRIYALEEGDETTKWIKKYFEGKREFENETSDYHKDKLYVSNSFMDKWVKEFGIGEKISIKPIKEGYGIMVRLHKSRDEKDEGTLLAYEGDGITQLFSILLQIETTILSAKGKFNRRLYGLDDLDGYKSNEFHYETRTLLIEEPELRLHPALQSKLADMMIDAYQNYNIHFIVETHSEYLIRKLQVLSVKTLQKKETCIDKENLSIYYLYDVNSNNLPRGENQVKKIELKNDGTLQEPFGEGFFDESRRLVFELLN